MPTAGRGIRREQGTRARAVVQTVTRPNCVRLFFLICRQRSIYADFFPVVFNGGGAKGKGAESALPAWKSRLFWATETGFGGVAPSEIDRLKKWKVADFFDLLTNRIEYANELQRE